MPAARAAAAYQRARLSTVSWALSPLGFGTTHSAAPSSVSCLLAEPGAGAHERDPVGADTRDRDHGGPPPPQPRSQGVGAGTQLGAGQLRGACRGPGDHVGDGEPAPEQLVAVGVAQPGGAVELPPGDAGAVQGRVEPVARVGEVGLVAAVHSPGLMPTTTSRGGVSPTRSGTVTPR
jgi:hypothetical protein